MQRSIASIKKELQKVYSPSEAEGIIRHIFFKLKGYGLTELTLFRNDPLPEELNQQLDLILDKLQRKEPIQYILKETDFFDLNFQVSPSVLIPRPETEELVDWIIHSVDSKMQTILDVGTGSGCIAISLKKALPQLRVMACDISTKALEIAQDNAQKLQQDIKFFELDILNPQIPQNMPLLDLLVSNPPYVTEKEKKLMDNNVLDYEPHLALFVPDNDPLRFYRALCNFGKTFLKPGGHLFWEINENYGKACCNLLQNNGYEQICLKQDINGKDRMLSAIKKNTNEKK